MSWQKQFQWEDGNVHFVLDQHDKLDFYVANPLFNIQPYININLTILCKINKYL